jgi:hypothetical protein
VVREAYQRRLDELQSGLSASPVTSGDRVARLRAEIARTEDTKERDRIQQRILPALQADVWEVRCETCGAFCWDRDEHYATALWNKSVERLANLPACCAASEDLRVDYDGMEIVKCHTCERRHLTLNPAH